MERERETERGREIKRDRETETERERQLHKMGEIYMSSPSKNTLQVSETAHSVDVARIAIIDFVKVCPE